VSFRKSVRVIGGDGMSELSKIISRPSTKCVPIQRIETSSVGVPESTPDDHGTVHVGGLPRREQGGTGERVRDRPWRERHKHLDEVSTLK